MISCASSSREDILFDDFEKGHFINWNKQGNSFTKPNHIDSIDIDLKNPNGKFVAYSSFEGEGESRSLGKLVSKSFVIQRNFINFLIAGGNHNTRECVNLIIKNKIVKVATGKNDAILRKVTWDVSDFEGEEAVIEIVDAMSSSFERNALGFIVVDQIVFSDNLHKTDVVFEDFESGTYNGWNVIGNAFESPRNRTNVYYPISANGFNGQYFAFSFGEAHDERQGKLISIPFTINHDYIKLLVGGGNHEGLTCVNLAINGNIVQTATGNNDGNLRLHKWDVRNFKGQIAHIEIIDRFSGSWGHIMADDIVFTNKKAWYAIPLIWISLLLLAILTYLIIKYKPQFQKNDKRINGDNESLENLKNIIKTSEQYLNSEFSVEDIATLSCLTEKNIKELFEKSHYKSLTNYINYLRVEAFKTKLSDPKNEVYTMISIAKQCGFKSKTSFYRVFKSITNQTPSEYKNESQ
jgi:AraC-like DNA-binding protein